MLFLSRHGIYSNILILKLYENLTAIKKTYKTNWILVAYTLEIVYMSSISKRLSLRVPANVIYRGLKDRRLERLFPEFFTGVTRRLTTSNKANSELQFTTTTYDSQIQIKEIFKLKVLQSNATEIVYTTGTNIANDPVVESIVYTHVANILYALLMLETGYVNGLMERQT
jgi:hypothetical protein